MSSCIYCRKVISIGASFCSNCGSKIPQSEMETIITKYFKDGYTYKTMLLFLKNYHQIIISERNLKYNLKSYGLKRKGYFSNSLKNKVDAVIINEIKGPDSLKGYRAMWHELRSSHGISIPRDHVMNSMRRIDPAGVADRQSRKLKHRKYFSKGPNYCWHIDGYDKLKPYGFPIHGCIDGFSRKILWLVAVPSNNNPIIIASQYLNLVEDINCVPVLLRTDCGTENGVMAASQSFLRRIHHDSNAGDKSHIYGSSHSNQRIEAWWSRFRHGNSSFYIDFFKELVDNHQYNVDNTLEKQAALYCFTMLLQREISKFKEHWNSHYIRKSKHSQVHGRPNKLYYLPDQNFPNQALSFDRLDHDEMKDYVDDWVDDDDDTQVYNEYFDYLSTNLILKANDNWITAKNNFLTLRSHAQ